jgi:hypothetical protein
MGFVRGSMYAGKDEDRHTVTSLDGYNSYIVIVDRATRYTWVFLSKTKTPKIDTITTFLKIHGASLLQQKYIRTDEGGELWRSHHFHKAMHDTGYILEPTASDASFQNGVAERSNRTLGDMTRSLFILCEFGTRILVMGDGPCGVSEKQITTQIYPNNTVTGVYRTKTKCKEH